MFVHRHGQFAAAAQAAALQNRASVSRCHALAKTVHTHTAANLGLIRSFWHSSFLTLNTLLLINIQNKVWVFTQCYFFTIFLPAFISIQARHYTVRLSIRSIWIHEDSLATDLPFGHDVTDSRGRKFKKSVQIRG